MQSRYLKNGRRGPADCPEYEICLLREFAQAAKTALRKVRALKKSHRRIKPVIPGPEADGALTQAPRLRRGACSETSYNNGYWPGRLAGVAGSSGSAASGSLSLTRRVTVSPTFRLEP